MPEVMVKKLCLDSRRVKPGDLFLAVPGLTTDGRKFIDNAINNGAIAILADSSNHESLLNLQHSKKIPIIPYDNLVDAMGYIAARFYGDPTKTLKVIGITGTNGKTSCTHFYAQLFNQLNSVQPGCAVLGTLGIGFLDDLKDSGYTTPDAIVMQENLARLKNEGASAIAMEVTAHALAQRRINGTAFHIVIFTNLTRDHLDDFLTMEEYWYAKKRLFTEYSANFQIINIDDPYGRSLFLERYQQAKVLREKKSHFQLVQNNIKEINAQIKYPCVIGYSTESLSQLLTTLPKHEAETFKKIRALQTESLQNTLQRSLPEFTLVSTEALVMNESGIQAEIASPWGRATFQCHLWGRFNVSNILATISALCAEGYSLVECCQWISTLKAVDGRMIRLKKELSDPTVIVDYAHTPNALQEVLLALKPHSMGKIWCVFGCGGDRDSGKRPLMAKIAEEFSDEIIVTQDNPRTEDPNHILKEIMKGFKNIDRVHVEADRKKAIEYAVLKAQPNDVVVIAGKGHENYQIIQNEKIPFNDQTIAQDSLNYRKNRSNA